jgi:hypothetical protein
VAVSAAAKVQPRNVELMNEASWFRTINADDHEIVAVKLLGGSQIFNDGLDT